MKTNKLKPSVKRPAPDEPSAADLRAIPPSTSTKRFAGRGKAALANARDYFATVGGRPKKGAKPAGSSSRSLRLPDVAWQELERLAAKQDSTVHAVLRAMVAEYLYTAPK